MVPRRSRGGWPRGAESDARAERKGLVGEMAAKRVKMKLAQKSVSIVTGVVRATYETAEDRGDVYERLPDTIEVELAPSRLEVLAEWIDERTDYCDPTMVARDLLRRLGLEDGPVRGGGS